jgi:hypothetical protein
LMQETIDSIVSLDRSIHLHGSAVFLRTPAVTLSSYVPQAKSATSRIYDRMSEIGQRTSLVSRSACAIPFG